MRYIPVSQGNFAIVDDENYEELSQHKWSLRSGGYAGRAIFSKKINGKQITRIARMHRIIMGVKPNQRVDHINRNPLDNRKANLRICSHQENCWNRGLYNNNTSGYKGVQWSSKDKKWRVYIKVNYRNIYLGRVNNPADGEKIYNNAAKKYFGNYAGASK